MEEKVAAPVSKAENTAVGIRRADHATPLYPQKPALTSLTSGGRSAGIVRLRTQAKEFLNFMTRISAVTRHSDSVRHLTHPIGPLVTCTYSSFSSRDVSYWRPTAL
jgi:hypothetical protein